MSSEPKFVVDKKGFSSFSKAVAAASRPKSSGIILLPNNETVYEAFKLSKGLTLKGRPNSTIIFSEVVTLNDTKYNLSFEDISLILDDSTVRVTQGASASFSNCTLSKLKGEVGFDCFGSVTLNESKLEDVPMFFAETAKLTATSSSFSSSTEDTDTDTTIGLRSETLNITLEKCKFENFGTGLYCEQKIVPDIAHSMMFNECDFVSCMKGIAIIGGTFKGSLSKFTNCFVGIDGLDSAVTLTETKFLSPGEVGVKLRHCGCIFTRVQVVGSGKGVGFELLGKIDSVVREGLTQNLDTGIRLSGPADSGAKHSLENVAFIKNRVGLQVQHVQTSVGGCVFLSSKEYSMKVDIDQKRLTALRVFDEPVIKLWFNNFIEPNLDVKDCDNESVLAHCRDPHPFKYSTEGEHIMWMSHIFERLMRAYRELEFYTQRGREAEVALNSVRFILTLIKPAKSALLSALAVNPRLGAFLARTPLRKGPLFTMDELFDSWVNELAMPHLFDEVGEILIELRKRGTIDEEHYIKMITVAREIRFQRFIQSSHARKLEYLRVMGQARPLEALSLAINMTDKSKYTEVEENELQSIWKDNLKVKKKTLLFLATMEESAWLESNIDVSWVNKFALRELVKYFKFHEKSILDIQQEYHDLWLDAALEMGNYKEIENELGILVKATGFLSAKQSFYNRLARAFMNRKIDIISFSDEIDQRTTDQNEYQMLSLPIQKLLVGKLNLSSAMQICRQFSVSSLARQMKINSALRHFLLAYKGLDKPIEFSIFDDGICPSCNEFKYGTELMRGLHCDESVAPMCKSCFKRDVERARGRKQGLVPGSDGILLDNVDLCLAEVKSEVCEAILDKYLHQHISSLHTKKKWNKCVISTCKGGTTQIQDGGFFICDLCGMFGTSGSGLIDSSGSFSSDLNAVIEVVKFFKAATQKSRHIQHYFPYGYGGNLFLDRGGQPNVNRVKECAQNIPEEIPGFGKVKDVVAVGLMQWVVMTNPTPTRALPKAPNIMRTILKAQNPKHWLSSNDTAWLQVQSEQEKEIAFQRLKSKHGSFWAFHGSSSGNWHSILRNGLKNMSNTSFQANGAAYGAGIYCSPQFDTADGYSRDIFNLAAAGKCMRVLAMIEVINKDIKKNGTIYVIPQENLQQIRFIAVGTVAGNGGYW